MMKVRWLVGLGVIIVLVLGFLYSGYWIGPEASRIRSLPVAGFSLRLDDGSDTSAEEVTLPHKWPATGVASANMGIYRVSLPPDLPAGDWAISVPDHMPVTELSVAGRVIERIPLTGHTGEALLFNLGSIGAGETLVFRVPAQFAVRGGLGNLWLGPGDLIHRQALWLSSLRELCQIWIIGWGLVIAFFAWGALWLSGQRILLPVALAGSGICLHQILPFVWGYWEGDDFLLAMYSASTTLTGVGLFFLLEVALRDKRTILTHAVLLALPLVIWIQFGDFLEPGTRRIINVAYIALMMVSSCLRNISSIIAQRLWPLLLVQLVFVARVLLAIQSLISNQGEFGFDDVEHHARMAPFAILVTLLLGARHIQLAMKNYEMANAGMAREIANYKAELALASQREQALAVQQAASAERLHWMQEIHDGLGSHLIAARFLADKVDDPRGLDAVKESIDDSLEDLRELVESLSPEPSTLPALLGALRYRIAPRYEKTGLSLLWSVDPMIKAGELSPAAALNVQRITQESLTNILKHAQASTVRVHIFTDGPSIVLRIEDDGKGFDPGKTYAGQGIESMKKRARDCGGGLTLTALNPGTRVELILPNGLDDPASPLPV